MVDVVSPYTPIPPMVAIPVESGVDKQVARNAVHCMATSLGLSAYQQAQASAVVVHLTNLAQKLKQPLEIRFGAVLNEEQVGLQIACALPWLMGSSGVFFEQLQDAFCGWVGSLVDEIVLVPGEPPHLILTLWRY